MHSFEETEKEEISSGFYIVCKLHLYVAEKKQQKEIILIYIE